MTQRVFQGKDVSLYPSISKPRNVNLCRLPIAEIPRVITHGAAMVDGSSLARAE